MNVVMFVDVCSLLHFVSLFLGRRIAQCPPEHFRLGARGAPVQLRGAVPSLRSWKRFPWSEKVEGDHKLTKKPKNIKEHQRTI